MTCVVFTMAWILFVTVASVTAMLSIVLAGEGVKMIFDRRLAIVDKVVGVILVLSAVAVALTPWVIFGAVHETNKRHNAGDHSLCTVNTPGHVVAE